jgi:thiamine pyrophosphokinase
MKTAVVLAGGDAVPPSAAAMLPDDALVVAADSGLHLARDLGLRVDRVVGDMDSVDPAVLEAARAAGAEIELHPAAKDATDLELAVDAAAGAGATRVVVVGGTGGRLDHFLANALLLASPAFAHLEIEAYFGLGHVSVTHGGRPAVALHGIPGRLVTLLPVAGPATGIRTTGLMYPLHGETLTPGSTRGVSNVIVEPVVTVVLDGGSLLIIEPGDVT